MAKSVRFILIFLMSFIVFQFSVNASVWNQNIEPPTSNLNMTVYRSPSCSCCGGWIDHLKQHGFQINDVKTEAMAEIKEKYQVPTELESCHTGLINGYVVEGHVPANDIKQLLKQKPNLVGLSVPQMPKGTPGMEMGNQKDPFAVVGFKKNGEVEIFKQYQSY